MSSTAGDPLHEPGRHNTGPVHWASMFIGRLINTNSRTEFGQAAIMSADPKALEWR